MARNNRSLRLYLPVLGISVAQFSVASELMSDWLYRDLTSGRTQSAISQMEDEPALVNTHDSNGSRETPLHIASRYGHTELVRWLVAHGARVNARSGQNSTPLTVASNEEIATILLKAGAKTDVVTNYGATPLQYAASKAVNGHLKMMKTVYAMRKHGAELDLISALILNLGGEARARLRSHPNEAHQVIFYYITPLHIAAKNGDIETARQLLHLGVEIDVGDWPGMNFGSGKCTPLFDAVFNDQPAMVDFLCSRGAKPGLLEGHLREAFRFCSPQIVEVLKRYTSVRPRQLTPKVPRKLEDIGQ